MGNDIKYSGCNQITLKNSNTVVTSQRLPTHKIVIALLLIMITKLYYVIFVVSVCLSDTVVLRSQANNLGKRGTKGRLKTQESPDYIFNSYAQRVMPK